MNETSSETTVSHTCLRRLGVINLCLNILILLLILVAFCAHHHQMMEDRHFEHGGRPGHERGWGGGGDFHRHMGRGDWGRDRERHFGDRGGFDRHDADREESDRPGRGGEGRDFGGGREMGRGMEMARQMPPDPASMTDGILAHLTQQLTLTDDQKAKIKPIIEQQVAQLQKDQQAHREAMQKQMQDGRAKIRPLLNADQQKQLDQLPVPGQKPANASAPAKPGNP